MYHGHPFDAEFLGVVGGRVPHDRSDSNDMKISSPITVVTIGNSGVVAINTAVAA
jgi:hypothetical protein